MLTMYWLHGRHQHHTVAPHRDAAWHNRAILRQIIEVPLAVEADEERFRSRDRGTRKKPAKYSQKRRKEGIEAATLTQGNISALILLPGCDQFRAPTFDPMHSLLEGLLKTNFFRVLVLGEDGVAEDRPDAAEEPDAGAASDNLSLGAVERLRVEAQDELKLARHEEGRSHDIGTIRGLRRLAKQLRANPTGVRKRVLGPKDMTRQRELLLKMSTPTFRWTAAP